MSRTTAPCSEPKPRLTTWSQARLERLFARYRDQFWPGRLHRYRVVVAPLEGALGRCDWDARPPVITVDAAAHRNDWHVRTTLLHEMCHAAAPGGHHSKFFAEVEPLLAAGAPVEVSTAETGGHFNDDAVPERFPLARRRFRLHQLRENNAFWRMLPADTPVAVIGDDDICQQIYDGAALEGVPWRRLWPVIGAEYGLLDVDGKPVARVTEQRRQPKGGTALCVQSGLDSHVLWLS
jgi:hypothetical protein